MVWTVSKMTMIMSTMINKEYEYLKDDNTVSLVPMKLTPSYM